MVSANEGRPWGFAPVRVLQAVLCVGILGAALAPAAKADAFNEKTVVTFNAPVEIPGRVLPAGTYVFKVMDSVANPNVVEIMNPDETYVYATVLAVPAFRLEPANKTRIRFEERAAQSPQAVRSWFYPGRSYGEQFVYPIAGRTTSARTTAS